QRRLREPRHDLALRHEDAVQARFEEGGLGVNTSAPGRGRIFVIAAFSLSCFGLLLFFWLAFGGPIPLKPQGYRVQIAFTDAATLADQADVRVAGVSIGKVVDKQLASAGDTDSTSTDTGSAGTDTGSAGASTGSAGTGSTVAT